MCHLAYSSDSEDHDNAYLQISTRLHRITSQKKVLFNLYFGYAAQRLLSCIFFIPYSSNYYVNWVRIIIVARMKAIESVAYTEDLRHLQQ
jgi:hypothetical protein